LLSYCRSGNDLWAQLDHAVHRRSELSEARRLTPAGRFVKWEVGNELLRPAPCPGLVGELLDKITILKSRWNALAAAAARQCRQGVFAA
jgi:hypothetical protein